MTDTCSLCLTGVAYQILTYFNVCTFDIDTHNKGELSTYTKGMHSAVGEDL